jgi:hypothetical protein
MCYLLLVSFIMRRFGLCLTVCYDNFRIIHVVDRSLPSKPCKTCKNRFHAGCLYKVFWSLILKLLTRLIVYSVVQYKPFFELPSLSFRYNVTVRYHAFLPLYPRMFIVHAKVHVLCATPLQVIYAIQSSIHEPLLLSPTFWLFLR